MPAWLLADTASDPALVLAPVEVTAKADSLNPVSSPGSAILGSERSLLDTPRSATTLTPERLLEQNIRSFADLAVQAPGMSVPSNYGLLTVPVIRGDTAETYVNGQRTGYNNYGYLPSFNSVEAVDIVRGPASVAFGAGYLVGGYVNFRTKQPDFEHSWTELTSRLGTWASGASASFGNASLQVDHTAPISRTLAYRISYEGQGGDTFSHRYGVKDDRQDLFVALAWKPSDDFRIDANAQIFWQNAPESLGVNRVDQNLIDHGIYQSDLGPVKLPRDAVLLQPGDDSSAWVGRAQLIATRDFSPDSQLVNRTFFERVDREREIRAGYHEDVRATTVENRTSYQRTLDVLGREQTLLAGFALRYEGRFGYADYDYGAFLAGYDITDPGTIVRPAVATYERTREDLLNPSLFWQHEIKLTDRLSALAGWREDFYFGKIAGMNDDGWGTVTAGSDQIDFAAFSQAYSLAFKARETLTFYATYNRMQTLGTNGGAVGGGYYFTGPTVNSRDFKRPSELIEIGAKGNLFDGRLFTGLSLFQQSRSRDDFMSPADIIVRGVEWEASWQPTAVWSVFANATFQRGRYDNGDIYQYADVGSPTGYTGAGDWDMPGFSDVLLNAGVRYKSPGGFGAGLRGAWQSRQNLNIVTPTLAQVTIPDQFQIDATLFYEREAWSASIDILNLTDERNWIYNGDVATGGVLISQSLPLRLQATIRLRF